MTLTVWTIHPLEVYKVMQKTGVLRCSEEHMHTPDSIFTPAYDWLSEQMRTRIGLPPLGVKYPVWVWYQWRDAKQAKPDLRTVRHEEKQGEHVLLECSVEEGTILLSDFDLWHCVLNRWYCALTEEEDQAFDQSPIDDTTREVRMKDSWIKIFDIHQSMPGWNSLSREDRSIQGTVWELRIEQVNNITHFRGTI